MCFWFGLCATGTNHLAPVLLVLQTLRKSVKSNTVIGIYSLCCIPLLIDTTDDVPPVIDAANIPVKLIVPAFQLFQLSGRSGVPAFLSLSHNGFPVVPVIPVISGQPYKAFVILQ
jgi:hypothetical protein